MNDRIRELLEQAGVKYVTMPKDTVYEKFAELIIQECIAVINSENYREHSEGWNSAIEWADGMIKEHFGVEE